MDSDALTNFIDELRAHVTTLTKAAEAKAEADLTVIEGDVAVARVAVESEVRKLLGKLENL